MSVVREERQELTEAQQRFDEVRSHVVELVRVTNEDRLRIAEGGEVNEVLSLLGQQMAEASQRQDLSTVIALANLVNEYAQAEADLAALTTRDYRDRFDLPSVPFDT